MESSESTGVSRPPSGLRDPREWHRGYPGWKIAGVCVSVAENLRVSVTAVRAVFLLLVLAHGVGLWLYAILWALLPVDEGEPSAVDRGIRSVRSLLRSCGPRGTASPDG